MDVRRSTFRGLLSSVSFYAVARSGMYTPEVSFRVATRLRYPLSNLNVLSSR